MCLYKINKDAKEKKTETSFIFMLQYFFIFSFMSYIAIDAMIHTIGHSKKTSLAIMQEKNSEASK